MQLLNEKQALFRLKNKVKPRLTEGTWKEVDAKVKEQWSPAQICGRFALEGKKLAANEFISIFIAIIEREAFFI